ncbi:MAG: T9SS type A sorting domain-containing protein [Ignavibacteriales bacterium]
MRIISTFLLFVLLSMVSFAQIKVSSAEEKPAGSYPIDGTHLLEKQDEQVRQYVASHPDMLAQMRLNKTAAWNFTVGTVKNWNSIDFNNGSSIYSVPSTCRKVGTNCYIFVENTLWGNRVTQAAVDSVALYFDSKTPANPNKGIYQTDVEAFGNPPDVDNDPKIIILIQDIKDGYSGSGGYIAGYFSSFNETNQAQSNKAEIYFLDADPGTLTTTNGLYNAISTTAHEFQHMIFWNYHQSTSQATFINEGCSMLAEINAGFSARGQSGTYGYNNETNYFLMGWRGDDMNKNLIDYSRASRFFLYLRDQFGMGIFKKIVLSPQFGFNCFNDALTQMGQSIKLANVYTNFMMANIVDDKTVSSAWGYNYQGLPKPTGSVFVSPFANGSSSLYNLAGDYITYNSGSDLKITFTSSDPIVVKALETGPTGKRVVDVPLNTQFSEPAFGTTYKTVTFAVLNPNESDEKWTSASYSFKSTGAGSSATELKWDTNEPTGYYLYSTSDTVCVTFDAVPGGKLDSVRVGLRRPGSITGGIYQYTGSMRPTPLGKPLAAPVTASISTEALPIYSGAFPYSKPFSNWATIDLRSYNIMTDKPFSVAFVIGSDPKTPGILATKYATASDYHNYVYLHSPSSGSPDWYYMSGGTDTAIVHLVRAYASLTTDVKQLASTVRPTAYALSQNYPNPFNPTTSIKYQLPEAGYVTLKVYDVLGNEVSTLVSEFQNPGSYNATFDGKNLASGIYLYKLSQGRYSETKKLMLMK